MAVAVGDRHQKVLSGQRVERNAELDFAGVIVYFEYRLVKAVFILGRKDLMGFYGALGQLLKILRNLKSVDRRAGLYRCSYGFYPLFGNIGAAMHNTHDRAYRRGSTVGVIAAVGGHTNRLRKITAEIKAEHGKRDIYRCVAEVWRMEFLDQLVAGRLPVKPLLVIVHTGAYCARSCAVLRNKLKSLFGQHIGVGLIKGHRLNSGKEDLAEHALAARVVDGGILIGKVCRKLGIAGGKAAPDLRTDGRAHAVGKKVVVPARYRRGKAAAHIVERVAVLIHTEEAVTLPLLGEMTGGNAHAILLDGVQIQKLKVKVVILHRLTVKLLGIKVKVGYVPVFALKRAA